MAPPSSASKLKPQTQSKSQTQTKLSSFFQRAAAPSTQNVSAKPKGSLKRPLVEENNSDDDVWASPVNSPRPASAKRKRAIVLSDDEETENIVQSNGTPPKAPATPTLNTPRFKPASSLTPSVVKATPSASKAPPQASKTTPSTSKGTPKSASVKRVAGQLSTSFINSFRYDEQDLLNDSVVEEVYSNIMTPASKTQPKKKKALDKVDDVEEEFEHLKFDFLKPAKIRDVNGNRPDHPDYDPRTLKVPDQFMRERTPGHRQWWQLKSQYFDTVLFFKVGKFYEMYHMDAVIGVENLNLTYMKGKYAHCGFPEVAYGRFADILVSKGYKVARVEQTETPAQLEERSKREKTKDKVVRRELCRITTTATRTYSPFEDDEKAVTTGDPDANFLMSICEKKTVEDGPTNTRVGVCFVDCAAGQFYLCEFVDNPSFSTLRTLLAHNQPTQLLHPRNCLSPATQTIINSILGAVPTEPLRQKSEFLTADETLKKLMGTDYLGSNVSEWPKALIETVESVSDPIPKPDSKMELALSALGGTLWYLQKCLIDVDLVTMRKFEIYSPATLHRISENASSADRWLGRRMILDGNALKSLHVLPPTDPLNRPRDATAKLDAEAKTFSLFNTVNRCTTSFGRRLLRQWLCSPTCDPTALKQRQEAVQFLCTIEAKCLIETATELLKGIPDLERLFQRIHTCGLKYRSEKHPDGRAQFFDNRHTARKVRDLCVTIDGLDKVQKLCSFFVQQYVNKQEQCPALIVQCLGNELTDMAADLEHFNKLLLNREKILKEGRVVPKRGVDPEYDEALEEVARAEEQLENYLLEQRKKLKSAQINYTGTGKNRYQLEVPDDIAKTLSNKYDLKSKRKGFKRFRTAELEQLIEDLSAKERIRDAITDDSTRRVFADFDTRKEKWARVVSQMATFDVLMSLASYCSSSSLQMCVPEFDFTSKKPYIDLRAGYHPSLGAGAGVLTSSASTYIPNDTLLGADDTHPAVMLLTGANMSGKSTLMRQTATLVVLAQIGSLVPAQSMRLTPVDRIFCRIGASDCLAAGQSTFYMELSETNVILRESTMHSLVIIDELGRGTSTYDGTALAQAVLRHLAEKVGCRTLFSTHYHSLCTTFEDHQGIALAHMACLVENDDETQDPSMEKITFLYALASGPSPKSFGFFTARMAGIKDDVVRRAYRYSKMLEAGDQCTQKLRNLSIAVREGRISDDELVQAVKAAS